MHTWVEIFLYFAVLILLGSFAYAAHRAAPWVPTKNPDLERAFALLKKHGALKSGEVFVDVGCGDGRVLCEAAKHNLNVVGYEISILQYIHSTLRVRKLPSNLRKNIQIRFNDFWNADLSNADIVYFFLTPKIYKKMKSKLRSELKSGAIVVAMIWPFEDWKPHEVNGGEGEFKIYLYKV